MEPSKEVGKLHTSCKNCIFAIYKGKTQIECKLEEITHLAENNVEILEAYDEEKEFYIVNNNKCLKYRESNWKFANDNLYIQMAQIYEEIALKYHAIIFAGDNMIHVSDTLQSLMSQKLPPVFITIVREPTSTLLPSELYYLLLNKCGISWKVENIIQPYTREQIIDIVVSFTKAPIYAVFNAGYIVKHRVFSNLNRAIHEDFFKFFYLTPDENQNGLIVSKRVHEAYQGNFNKPLIEKLKEDNCPYIYSSNNWL